MAVEMEVGGERIGKKKTVKQQIRDTKRLLSRVCGIYTLGTPLLGH